VIERKGGRDGSWGNREERERKKDEERIRKVGGVCIRKVDRKERKKGRK
jgi:hypothetical protein